MGLVLCPLRTIRALRAGRAMRNLYGSRADEVLPREVDSVCASLRRAA
jgi:hypothetical protein